HFQMNRIKNFQAEQFRRKFKDFRNNLGLSQKEFGDKLGVTSTTIGRYESGDMFPSVEILLKMCEYGDVGTLFSDTVARAGALVKLQLAFDSLVGIQNREEELFEQYKR